MPIYIYIVVYVCVSNFCITGGYEGSFLQSSWIENQVINMCEKKNIHKVKSAKWWQPCEYMHIYKSAN